MITVYISTISNTIGGENYNSMHLKEDAVIVFTCQVKFITCRQGWSHYITSDSNGWRAYTREGLINSVINSCKSFIHDKKCDIS